MASQPDAVTPPATSQDGATVAELLLTKNRYVAIVSAAFPVRDLNVRSVTGVERLGEPFRINVHFSQPTAIHDFGRVPGQTLTIGLKLRDGGTRYFHGVVTRLDFVGLDETRRTNYVAEIRPWLWLLRRRRNARVFQNRTSLEIIKEVLGEHPNSSLRDRTAATPPVRPFCVQHDETDLSFVSRLMEQDGIYYFFEHGDNQHTMVLADAPGAHEPCDPEAIHTHIDYNRRDRDVFWEWRESARLMPGRVATNDYDHEKPRADLSVTAPVQPVRTGGIPATDEFELNKSGGGGASGGLGLSGGGGASGGGGLSRVDSGLGLMDEDLPPMEGDRIPMKPEEIPFRGADTDEVFTFPGHHLERADGEHYARLRAEEIACNAYRVHVRGIARQVATGTTFKAANPYHIANQDMVPSPTEKFLAVGVRFRIKGEVDDLDVAGPSPNLYESTVEAITAATPFRPARRTPWPRILGPQTAVVVGNKGEEITTDEYGRIKVHFFWDRLNPRDDVNSSCWVRVAQSWAGSEFGALVTPRIGQEVVVSFLHGNPDWPLVTGTVYNARNMPPVALPALATQSTFRTRSSPDGTEGNELRFEDRAGSEEVYLRAQKNLEVDVQAQHNVFAGNSFSVNVPAVFVPGGAPGVPNPLGSRIEMSGDTISLTVTTVTGLQTLMLGPEGITLLGTKVELLATNPAPPLGGVTSFPMVIPAAPTQVAAALADIAKEEAMGAVLP